MVRTGVTKLYGEKRMTEERLQRQKMTGSITDVPSFFREQFLEQLSCHIKESEIYNTIRSIILT